jgi:hypothetical protein
MPKRRQKENPKSQIPIPKKNRKIIRKTRNKKEKAEADILYEEKIEENEENQPPTIITNETRIGNEKIEQSKKLVMWTGISCIMIIFFILWIFTLKYEFKVSTKSSTGNTFNWSQTKAELTNVMAQVKQGVEQIKQIQKSDPGTLPVKSGLTPEQINLLKGKLMNEASSTASSTEINIR